MEKIMAAIDKIYGSKKQWKEFHAWATKNRPSILPYFYTLDSGGNPKYGPITNLDEEDDMWLLKNCPLTFVTDRIKDQYNLGSKT
jgi:hypothetical protein